MKYDRPDRSCILQTKISKELLAELETARNKLQISNMSDYVRLILTEFKQIDFSANIKN